MRGKVIRDGIIYRTGRNQLSVLRLDALKVAVRRARKLPNHYPKPEDWLRWNRYWRNLSYRPDRNEVRALFLPIFLNLAPDLREAYLSQGERLERGRG